MKYHLLPQRRPLLQSPRTRPRKATVGAMFAVGGMDASKGRAVTHLYPDTQRAVMNLCFAALKETLRPTKQATLEQIKTTIKQKK